MGLTSSLFSGVSGLAALGNSMTVIGDNIANVNTVGFKASRVLFQDILSQTVATQSGSAQVGRGTALGDVTAAFDQGSFESTESATDLAIGGEGFFIVRHPDNPENQFYTRAGSFRFDKDGNFVNPAGYIVKGWELARNDETGDVEDIGSIKDIKLANFTSPPEATDRIKVIANLDAQGGNNTTGADALSQAWDGDLTLDSHIGDTAFEYQTTIKVYDSLGSTHDVTVYFDRGELDNQYEFIVTCNPAEDERQIFGANTDSGRGLLGRGTLQFTPSGILGNSAMTFERFVGSGGGLAASGAWAGAAPGVSGAYSGTAALPATYTFTAAAPVGDVGTDAIRVNVSGAGSGFFTIPASYAAGDSVEGPDGMFFQFAVGDTVAVGNTFDVTITAGDPDDLTDANAWSDMSGDYTNQHFTFGPDFLGGTDTAMSVELNFGTAFNGTNWVPDSLSTTQFSSASTTIFQTATGYGAGDLQSISVDVDGAITGQYSNGQVTPLFRVALAKFQNTQGLFKEGGNLFRATRNSGERVTGRPGANGLGSIASNSLEQSNVDMSNEFVKMITAQRGFQANSKIVTTVDSMLSDVINMKR
jgi:flagellar hook protein FlgE